MSDTKYDILLFDLDGTLTDPGIGITNSVAYALKKQGISVADRSELYKFIGPPLLDSFQNYYGMSTEQAETAIRDYREYFSDKGLYENELYDGMKELLQKLCDAGKTLIVATSKPEEFARLILEHFELTPYFSCIAGASMDNSRTHKASVIEYALEKCQITDKCRVVMIGDREYDIFGAKKCGLDSIGVLYGYGSQKELLNAGADYIAGDLRKLEEILFA